MTDPMADERFSLPKQVAKVDTIFGGNMAELMPPYEDVPEEFRRERDPFSEHVHQWFFNGIDTSKFSAKPGINGSAAWGHLAAIMRSWEPKHEHKTAAVAWLMSKWFEVPEKGS